MMRDLLERAGFVVHRTRADCIHCGGASKGTVSFTDEVAYCHRCAWTANAAQLARSLGESVPRETPEHRSERLCAERFRKWLSEKYQAAANEERYLARAAELAKQILKHFYDCEPAWDALARWYHAERRLAEFFELAQCGTGRSVLFRAWLEKEGMNEKRSYAA
jgi:hypothetical protein